MEGEGRGGEGKREPLKKARFESIFANEQKRFALFVQKGKNISLELITVSRKGIASAHNRQGAILFSQRDISLDFLLPSFKVHFTRENYSRSRETLTFALITSRRYPRIVYT